MLHSPRLAVGTVQCGTDHQPMLWALMAILERSGLKIQAFLSQSRFVPRDGALSITGQGVRHLDSWLMTRDTCLRVYSSGAGTSDLVVVEGRYDAACESGQPIGGSLDTLCQWLDLPRLVVVDASRWRPCLAPLPTFRPDGVLLDCVQNPHQAAHLRTTIEALWGAPVLGMMDAAPEIRAAIGRLTPGTRPPKELCQALARHLAPRLRVEQLLRMAGERTPLDGPPPCAPLRRSPRGLNVAVAYDDAFHCYFPDTLDALEAHGARIHDFSPLHGECLPPDTHIVYLGCGHIEHHAEALAANHCIKQALRSHVRAGRRVYAEGSGLAYLGCDMELPDGRRYPMAGVLPLISSLHASRQPPRPVEVTLAQNTWLGAASSRIRGYLNTNWNVHAAASLTRLVVEPEHRGDLIGRHPVIASRIHLNPAAQPALLRGFLESQRTAHLSGVR